MTARCCQFALELDRRTVAAALVLTLGGGLTALPAQATPAAERFVRENVGKGFTILNGRSAPDAERHRQFREFVLGLTDMRRVALFTLGQYVNGASRADLDAFVQGFTEYAVAAYEARLLKYSGQTLMVTGSVDRAANDSIVTAIVVDPAGTSAPPIRVAFRVRPNGEGRPAVTDIQIEGIWLAISQRADITGYLQQNGGSIPASTARLCEQARQLRGSAQPASQRKSVS